MAIDPNEVQDKVDSTLETGKGWFDGMWTNYGWFKYAVAVLVILAILWFIF